MSALPLIMVAPNGARRTKADHPALPMGPHEIAATARACFDAGAGAIHAHVRDDEGKHSLDAGRYAELLALLRETVPLMRVQISTEAVGVYSQAEQRALVRKLKPRSISAAIAEFVPAGADDREAAAFYSWCADEQIDVQHILYSASDVTRLAEFTSRGIVPFGRHSVIYVLGRYTAGQQSRSEHLAPFLEAAKDLAEAPDWMVCAFGTGETECLAAALKAGGSARVGFENSLWNADGSLAASNEARVAVIRRLATELGRA